MAENLAEFRISFRSLLSDVTKALGWPEPIYSQASLEMNRTNVVLVRGLGPTACFFRGEIARNLAESEEQAAEQAIDFLVQKKHFVVQDANLERREMYKSCCKFYKEKREALESAEQATSRLKLGVRKKCRVSVLTCLPKPIPADLWSIWLQVMVAYQVAVDEMDFMIQPNGRHVCCFTVTWHSPSSREMYFIGGSADTLDQAKQSLAKKAIAYFQSVYGFSVKDANFNRMRYSRMQCSFQRTRYLSVKERHVCVVADLESVPVFVADSYYTPKGPTYGIRTGKSLSPPPKKHKILWRESSACTGPQDPDCSFGNAESKLYAVNLKGGGPASRA